MVNSFNRLNQKERKKMSGEKETLKGSMYSAIHISFILWLVLSTRKEKRYMMEQRREICSEKEPLKGWYIRYSDFRISNQIFWSNLPIGPAEGGIYEQKSEMRVCMPLIDSHVNPCDKFFQSAPRKWKKKMHRERTPKGGLYATHLCISFNYCDYWF